MAKPKRDAIKTTRRRPCRLTPARHTIAKQSAAVLALGLGLAAGAPAEATIIYTQLPGGGKTLVSDESWEFLTYTGNDLQFLISHYSYARVEKNVQGGQIGQNVGANAYVAVIYNWTDPQYNNAKLLQAGYRIGEPSGLEWAKYGWPGRIVNYTGGSSTEYGYFLGKRGYVGLRFNPGDGPHYGWAEVSMLSDGLSVTLYGYAYETEVGAPINAGAVPLPSSLLLLGSGAAGLLAYRRRKRAA